VRAVVNRAVFAHEHLRNEHAGRRLLGLLLQVDAEHFLGEFEDDRVPAAEIFALPAPAEMRQRRQGEPDVVQRAFKAELLVVHHHAVNNCHGADV